MRRYPFPLVFWVFPFSLGLCIKTRLDSSWSQYFAYLGDGFVLSYVEVENLMDYLFFFGYMFENPCISIFLESITRASSHWKNTFLDSFKFSSGHFFVVYCPFHFCQRTEYRQEEFSSGTMSIHILLSRYESNIVLIEEFNKLKENRGLSCYSRKTENNHSFNLAISYILFEFCESRSIILIFRSWDSEVSIEIFFIEAIPYIRIILDILFDFCELKVFPVPIFGLLSRTHSYIYSDINLFNYFFHSLFAKEILHDIYNHGNQEQ